MDQLKVEEKMTQPPKRYTEGSLLGEMERLGLGTPATRAGILETLKERGYVQPKGKTLLPTEKAGSWWIPSVLQPCPVPR